MLKEALTYLVQNLTTIMHMMYYSLWLWYWKGGRIEGDKLYQKYYNSEIVIRRFLSVPKENR